MNLDFILSNLIHKEKMESKWNRLYTLGEEIFPSLQIANKRLNEAIDIDISLYGPLFSRFWWDEELQPTLEQLKKTVLARGDQFILSKLNQASHFHPLSNCEKCSGHQLNKDSVLECFKTALDNESRISNFSYLLGYHPKFFSVFQIAHSKLMYEDTNLDPPIRHYIAIMAAAAQGCAYFVTLEEMNFIECDGNREWLKGIEHVSNKKIQKLQSINLKMVKSPWAITKEDIGELLCDPIAANRWSPQSLIHALTILAHYHSMSQFALACGLIIEIDHPLYEFTNSINNESSLSPNTIKSYSDGPERIVANLMNVDTELIQNNDNCIQDEFIDLISSPQLFNNSTFSVPEYLKRYINADFYDRLEFRPKDGVSDEIICRASEFNWLEHGYTLLQKICQDGTEKMIDDEFKAADDLTYGKVATVDCSDTEAIRLAMKRYTQCLLGCYYEEYNYKIVDTLLKNYCNYIKKVSYYPFSIKNSDFESLAPFVFTEKLHINIILMESRKKAEMLFFLRAYQEFRQHNS